MPNNFKRLLDLPSLLNKKSFFLLGPRSTGKTFLIREQLQSAILIDLLRSELFLSLSQEPNLLESIIDAEKSHKKTNLIVIDEIQKIPLLLDEVHRLIETRHFKFLLTGSSARKLRHGHANLLAGRAWIAHLFPLCFPEIKNFNLERYLRFGGLPHVYPSDEPIEELQAYTNTYLYEEIQAEGLIRKIPQFLRFLKMAALSNGQILNFSQLSSDTGIAASTLKEHYTILEDTLLGFYLHPFTKTQKRKATTTAKFYLFDTGVTHTLAQTKTLERNSDLYGRSFEQWIAMELRAYLHYKRNTDELTFWRSKHQHEVDFIIGDTVAIETKASKKVSDRDLKNLEVLAEENIFKRFYLVSHDPVERQTGKFRYIHWKTFIEELWEGKII